jgi:hypothetical protein
VVAAKGVFDMTDIRSLEMLADMYAYVVKTLGKELPSVESFCANIDTNQNREKIIGIFRKFTVQEADILFYEYALSSSVADIIKNEMQLKAENALKTPGGCFALFTAKHLVGSGASLVVALVIDEFNASGYEPDEFLIPSVVDGALCWCIVKIERKEAAADIPTGPLNAEAVQSFDLGAWMPGNGKVN